MIRGSTKTSTADDDAVASGLYWTIKSSFVSYVASTAGGTHSMSDELEVDDTGTFRFPSAGSSRDASTWTLRFTGDVRFSGHFGMLFVAIVDPWLTISADGGGKLSIADISASEPHPRLTIAKFEPATPLPYAGYLIWPPLTPMLSSEGAELFGGAYPAGHALDPMKIALRDEYIR